MTLATKIPQGFDGLGLGHSMGPIFFWGGGNEKQDKAMAIYVGFPLEALEYLIIYANAKISVGFSFFCMALGNAPNVSLYLDDPRSLLVYTSMYIYIYI